MVNRADSKRVKAHEASEAKMKKLEEAVTAYNAEQEKPDGVARKGLRKIALEFGVDKATLSRRLKGGRSIQEANALKQKLTPAEEKVIADHIIQLGQRALGPTRIQIEAFANWILEKKHGSGKYEPVGKTWLYEFYARHPEIHTYWSRSLDTQRAGALNETVVKHWFDLVKTDVVDQGILPQDSYGMDETNCPRGNLQTERVAGGAGKRTQHRQGGANRETVTALVTICADGTTLTPTIVFKGSNLWTAWTQKNIAKATFACSPKGWTDQDLAIHWIETQFDPQTREKAQGRTRALFMDGHSSHFTEKVIEFGLSRGIIIIGYPPHCTHALQGLDVVCFAKMKAELKNAVAEFEELYQHPVAKADFTEVFGNAFLKAFTEESVCAAFKATGIHPYDPSVIKPEQMKPAESKSVCGSFALTQTSPIKAITRSFRAYIPSSFETDLSHARAPSPDTPLAPSSLPRLNRIGGAEDLSASANPTPTRTTHVRTREENDTSLPNETPSKRMRILTANLSATRSASFLTSKTPYTSSTPIPRLLEKKPLDISEPDWSLIKTTDSLNPYTTKESLGHRIEELTSALCDAKHIIDVQRENEEIWAAQAVLADMTLFKMNKVVHAREEERSAKKNQANLALPGPGEGFGRIWTDQAILDFKRRQREEAEREEAEKQKKSKNKEELKVKKVALEAEWKEIMSKHQEAVKKWQEQCQMLKELGEKRKDWPKRPTHISKKDLTALRLGNDPDSSENATRNDMDEDDEEDGGPERDLDERSHSDEEDNESTMRF